ncbi:hypothetical protein [Streptomyces sp. NBC_01451]|uniref:hypothetical protein n=1 Tax=Streptomyces sp. NBC_01451 TaxID=2903872 RepID=UPI002E37FECC|nr:hypothetical protein [Streptomyces sp. NBC_01451]
MNGIKRKVTMAVLAGATVVGALAMPATASADGGKFVQLQVCSASTETVKFYFVGENQHGDWVGSRFWEIAPKGCTTAEGWWWLAGRSVEFHHRKPSTGWRWEQRVVPANGHKNGDTIRLDIG